MRTPRDWASRQFDPHPPAHTLLFEKAGTIRVRGLLFDLCGVLYDDTVWRRWLLQLLSRVGLHTHYNTFFHVWDREYQPAVDDGCRGYWEALRGCLLALGLSNGQIDEIQAAGQARRRDFEEQIRPLPGVCSTLAQLSSKGVQLAVLSSTCRRKSDLHDRLGRLGLSDLICFDFATRGNHDTESPARRFTLACSAMNAEAHEVGYVGRDRCELDAAAAAGLVTLAVNYDADARADVYLDEFHSLVDRIESTAQRVLAG